MNIKIEGLTELAGLLEKLKLIPQGEAVRQALLDGAGLITTAARANAPIAAYPTHYRGRMIAPGGLRKSLMAAPGKSYKNFLQAYAFTLRRMAPHAHLVEFGTKPHVITPKKGKMLRFGRGLNIFAKKVNHPGSRENPFFRKAIRSQRNAVKRLLESKVKQAFDALGRTA